MSRTNRTSKFSAAALILLTLFCHCYSHGANVPLTTSRTLYVATNGNNATAEAESLSQPFRDPYAAKLSAAVGDTIFVFPGTYSTNNLLKTGVNWHFYPGSRVQWTDTNGTGIGIWDDRGNGACTSSITGFGEFYVRAASNDTANLSLLGTLVITNAASEVSLYCKRLEGTFHELNLQAVVHIKNCRRVFLDADEVIDPWPRNTFFFDDGGFTQLAAPSTGIYWEHGEFHSHARRVWVSGYALYGNEVTAAGAIENWWHTGDYLDNELGAGAVGTPRTSIYMVGKTALWKYWVRVQDIRTEDQIAWTHFGSGKGYVTAQKLGTSHSSGIGVQVSNTGTNELWFDIQKIAAKGKFLQVVTPNVANIWGDVLHYDPLAAMSGPVFDVQTGVAHLQGGGIATNVAALVSGSYTNDSARLDRLVGIPNASTRTNKLPPAASFPARPITVFDAGATATGTNVWLATLAGAAITNISANNGSVTVMSDGATWRVISQSP